MLVLNCGSSSLKFQVIEPAVAGLPREAARKTAGGLVDRIGGEATCRFVINGYPSRQETELVRNHEEAVRRVLSWLDSQRHVMLDQFDAVGHRVVHGGNCFTSSVLINDEVIAGIEALNDLAPLHNPACLSGIRAVRAVLGHSVPMVAVFDTSFHHTLPDYAYTYAIPRELSGRHGIRRYGFHGLAHRYVTLRYGEMTATPNDQIKIITLHLGNGCSASAICGGQSVDTSMGFTPLEGLVMGTRSGDLDPAVVGYLSRKEGVPVAEIEAWLNERSGLLGISGRSNDMRELTEHAKLESQARLAINLFCYRARKYLGAYMAVLGGADAVVFSGGIGENSPLVRAQICEGMEWCGLELDSGRNVSVVGVEGRISSPQSRMNAYVIPSDEELIIAEDTANVIQK